MTATVFMHSSETMPEIQDASVRLFIGPGLYLGPGVDWMSYRSLYDPVYVAEGLRVIRRDGVFVVIQCNAYMDGNFICRYKLLLDLLLPAGWCLIDERVLMRKRACHFQVPFSHVLVFIPPNGTVRRNDLNKSNRWFQGIWDYPQNRGGALNSYPHDFCRMLIGACTDKDDLVLDPFCGTGALVGAAGQMGRRGIGYEIDAGLIPTIEKNGCSVVGCGD